MGVPGGGSASMLRVTQLETDELPKLWTGDACIAMLDVRGIVGVSGVSGVVGTLAPSVSERLSKPSWDLRNLSTLSSGPKRFETVNGREVREESVKYFMCNAVGLGCESDQCALIDCSLAQYSPCTEDRFSDMVFAAKATRLVNA